MKSSKKETKKDDARKVINRALIVAVIGVGIWMAIAIHKQRNVAGIQLGFEWYLQTIGTAVISIGLLGCVFELLIFKHIDEFLNFAVLAAVGLAVYSKDGLASIGIALVCAVVLLNKYFAQKRGMEEASEDSP